MHDPNNGPRHNRPRSAHVALRVIPSGLPSPRKDFHMSRTIVHPGNGLAPCQPTSCKNRRRECRLPAKKREGAPEGAVFCALRNPEYPPNFLVGAPNAQHLMRIFYPAPAPCRSGGGLEEGEEPPPSPTTKFSDAWRGSGWGKRLSAAGRRWRNRIRC